MDNILSEEKLKHEYLKQNEGYKKRIDKAVTKLSTKETTVKEEEKYFSDLL